MAYGGLFENRARLTLEVAQAVRREMGPSLPLFLRISASDWTEGGWTIGDSVELARRAQPLGVDLIDVSSGGNVAGARIPVAPGYQVAFSERIRREAGLLHRRRRHDHRRRVQAESILLAGQADLILLAREFLRDPYFPMHAAQSLGLPASSPKQYLRAFPQAVRRPG